MQNSLYLDLMEKCLTGMIYGDAPQDWWNSGEYNPVIREEGKDWPSFAHSMIGLKRMRNLRELCERVIAENIPGDFIETGVWRGGAVIMMRAVLKANGISDRNVWCADSFEGLPKPDEASYPQDAGDVHHTFKPLAISQEDVRANFAKYELLDEQVKFLKGWFKDTLPFAPIEKLAILRLDGDMYQSTIEALNALYDKLSLGGFVIIDDFALPGCHKAVLDFRIMRDIGNPIHRIDSIGAYWQK